MKKKSVVVIFDIGKTNKKLLLFDDHYHIVLEESIQFKETTDEDGYPCEDIQALTNWVRITFEKIFVDDRFDVTAVNFSAYGASFVYVDENLNPLLPLYNYLKPYSENLKRKFYDQYGGETEFSKKTASPVLGSLNSGMQLYRIKYEKPGTYSKIKYALHLPQYLSSILTKTFYSDITSIGCHTNLWDFTSQNYHNWVFEEGIKEKLAPILPSDACVNVQYGGKTIYIGIGLHDSSAALIPYLANFNEPFILISTGTWCISLNPFDHSTLTQHDLENDCLCYLTYQGRPVKASRLFAGHEHEQKSKQLAEHFKVPLEQIIKTEYNSSIKDSIKNISLTEILLKEPATSYFDDTTLNDFENPEKAYHELIINIVTRQLSSTKLVLQGNHVKRIFIDGGFSKNSIYMNLMAAVFPGIEIYAASVAQASALGAALAIHKHWNKKPLTADLIELKFYKDTTRD